MILSEPGKTAKKYLGEILEERDADILLNALGLQNKETILTNDSGKQIEFLLLSRKNPRTC